MSKFKSNHYNVPDTIKPGQSNVKVEWFYDEATIEQIEEVKPGCGCTADVKVLSDKIVAYYNDSTPSNLGTGSKKVDKSLRVYFRDGNPLKVTNERGVLVYNTQGKQNEAITFSVTVKN